MIGQLGKRVVTFGAEEQLLRSVGRVLAGSFVGYDDVNERQRLPLAPHGTHYRKRKRSRYLSTIPPFLHISPHFEISNIEILDWETLLTFPKWNDERDRDWSSKGFKSLTVPTSRALSRDWKRGDQNVEIWNWRYLDGTTLTE